MSSLLMRQQQLLRLQSNPAASCSSSLPPLSRQRQTSTSARREALVAVGARSIKSNSTRRRPTASAAASAAPSTIAPTTENNNDESDLPSEVDVVIVGAGLAGLAAARALLASSPSQSLRVLILEASDGVGGRARTDVHPDGFLLDRGFQIFLTGYPECKRVLDYEALDLQPFYAGALVRFEKTWHRVADPFRHPLDGLLSLLPSNAVGSPIDKVNVGLFRLKCVLGGSLEALLSAEPERTTRQRLTSEGFSDAIVDRFFRPFLGGIFFDRSLGVSDRLFAFVMRMLATGSNCLPSRGIGAMAQQLAEGLPSGCVRLGRRVEGVELVPSSGDDKGGKAVAARVRVASRTPGGEPVVVAARRAVVVASEGPEARRLVEGALMSGGASSSLSSSSLPPPSATGVGTACLYFDAPPDSLPSSEAILYLNGGLTGPQDDALVNNCCFPSTVAPSYAPAGRALVSVSTIGTRPDLDDAALEAGARRELESWFGVEQVGRWRHLRTYRIPYAQPPQAPPTNLRKPVAVGGVGVGGGGGSEPLLPLFVCGDHMDTATFDGALLSGRRAAEAVLERVALSKVA